MILFLFSGSFSALFAVVAEIAFFSLLSPSGTGIGPWHIVGNAGAPFGAFLVSFFFVAVIEESMKLLVLARQAGQAEGENLRASATLFGLGFAVTEITLASISGIGSPVPVAAAGGMLILHVLTALLYGISVPSGKNRLKMVLIIGIFIHLAYDILLALT